MRDCASAGTPNSRLVEVQLSAWPSCPEMARKTCRWAPHSEVLRHATMRGGFGGQTPKTAARCVRCLARCRIGCSNCSGNDYSSGNKGSVEEDPGGCKETLMPRLIYNGKVLCGRRVVTCTTKVSGAIARRMRWRIRPRTSPGSHKRGSEAGVW